MTMDEHPTHQIRIRVPWKGYITGPTRFWVGDDEHDWLDLTMAGRYEITGTAPSDLIVRRLDDSFYRDKPEVSNERTEDGGSV